MAIQYKGKNTGSGSSGGTFTPPAGTSFLVAVYGGKAVPTAMTWNGVALTQAIAYDGKVAVFYLANPAIGNYAFGHNGSTDCAWACYWLNGVNKTSPIGSSNSQASYDSLVTANNVHKGEFMAMAEYNYWDDNGADISGTNIAMDQTFGSPSGYTGTIARCVLITGTSHQYQISGEDHGLGGYGRTCWASFKPCGVAGGAILI